MVNYKLHSSAVALLRLFKLLHPLLEYRAEVADQSLHGPSSAVSQGANGMPLDLLAQFPQHVDLLRFGIAFH